MTATDIVSQTAKSDGDKADLNHPVKTKLKHDHLKLCVKTLTFNHTVTSMQANSVFGSFAEMTDGVVFLGRTISNMTIM